jgi:hypothetical protein
MRDAIRTELPATLNETIVVNDPAAISQAALLSLGGAGFCPGSAALPGAQCARAPRPKLVCRSRFDLSVLRDPHAAAR